MRIEGVTWLRAVVDKLAYKHSVQPFEVEEALSNRPKIHRVESGKRKDEDVYMALGRTDSGRYVSILFIYKTDRNALILSERDMALKERRRYARK